MPSKAAAGSTSLVFAWAVAVLAGLAALIGYDGTPGVGTKRAPELWPADAGLARRAGRTSILVFLHPRCPCSDATLGELEEILAAAPRTPDARVVFVAPEGTTTDWARTDLRERAGRIPGVAVVDDAGGTLARRFGAETSGTTLVYDRDGRLAFRGGVTPSRGHLGDCVGRTAVAAVLADERADVAETPVFGCPLLGREAQAGR